MTGVPASERRLVAWLRRSASDDRGLAATIVLFPIFAVVTFGFVQALSWQQDQQMAVAAANRASAAVALYGADIGAAQAEAVDRLQRLGMSDVSVSVTRDDAWTIVDVEARAPGILVGTSTTVTAHAVTPSEGFKAA